MGESVLQDWVTELSFMQQTVLITAIRGCDLETKHGHTKPFVKALRGCILKSANPGTNDFMDPNYIDTHRHWEINLGCGRWKACFDVGHFPMHWVSHAMHASMIIAYMHPDEVTRDWWAEHVLTHFLDQVGHLQLEPKASMIARLTDGVRCKG